MSSAVYLTLHRLVIFVYFESGHHPHPSCSRSKFSLECHHTDQHCYSTRWLYRFQSSRYHSSNHLQSIGVAHVYVVHIADFDSTDIVRCRWSTNATTNFNNYNECNGVCSGVPGAVLFPNNCTLRFSLVNATWYAAVALQIEDYYDALATTPMSSVPLQFLFYGYTAPGGCSTQPVIIGDRPNQGTLYDEIRGSGTF